jgi:hypothetical protein
MESSPQKNNEERKAPEAGGNRQTFLTLVALVSAAAGYLLGNALSIIDIQAGNYKLSLRPIDRIEKLINSELNNTKEPERASYVYDHIVRILKANSINSELGTKVILLAKAGDNPFKWGYSTDVKIEYRKELPTPASGEYFEVCENSPLTTKMIAINVFDKNGKSIAGGSATAGSIYKGIGKRICDPNIVYTGDKQLANAFKHTQGSYAKAKELIVIPLMSLQ